MNLYKTLNTYPAGDMTVHYWADAHGVPGMSITPTHLRALLMTLQAYRNLGYDYAPVVLMDLIFELPFPSNSLNKDFRRDTIDAFEHAGEMVRVMVSRFFGDLFDEQVLSGKHFGGSAHF